VVKAQSINEIADNSAEHQPEGDLAADGVGIEMVPIQKEREQGYQSNDRQHGIVTAEQAPSRASIAPMNKLKEPINDDFFAAKCQVFHDNEFGELIKHQDGQANERHSFCWTENHLFH